MLKIGIKKAEEEFKDKPYYPNNDVKNDLLEFILKRHWNTVFSS